jgi:protein SCO1/2
MKKREFIKGMAGASLGVSALAAGSAIAATSGRPGFRKISASERRRDRFPNLPLMTHDGKVVRFYDDLIKDKTVLINFMYARCGDVCPGTTVNLKRVQKALGDRVGRDIFMYSITLEPEHDTPAVLRDYAKLFQVGPGWTFLTGAKRHIETLRRRLGYRNSDPAADKDRTQHIGVVKFGIEPLERWGMAPSLGSAEAIADYIYWLEPGASVPSRAMLEGTYEDPGNIEPRGA